MAEPKKYQNKYSIYRLESFKSKVFISRTVKETGAVSKFFYYTYIDKNGNSTTKRIDKTIGKKNNQRRFGWRQYKFGPDGSGKGEV